jgi:hypothetical protein
VSIVGAGLVCCVSGGVAVAAALVAVLDEDRSPPQPISGAESAQHAASSASPPLTWSI